MSWPTEFVELVDEVRNKLGVARLYFEDEISGLSGARTFRARTDMDAGIGHRVVLKIGEPDQISDERDRYNQARKHFGTHPALQDFGGEGGSHSWLAMSVALSGLGRTLRDRFDGLSDDEIATVIDRLFGRAIRLDEKTGFPRALSSFAQYALHPDVIPKLREIGDTPYTLADWWGHAAASDEQRSTEAFIHGDLHGGNVLLAGNGESIEVSLIDFGLSGMGHAYRDLAKLERDLCLFVESARDNSVTERLSAIERQLAEDRPASEPKHGSIDPDVERVVRAIRQIRDVASGFAREADGDRWRHEYDVALTAQFMFSAANPKLSDAKRRAALARACILRDRLIARSPVLEPEASVKRERKLADRACMVAYSLLRLDQLPRGGWSRSLPQWMEALWEGEHGTVFRSPAMKDDGGADSTGYAVNLLSRFATRLCRGGPRPSDGTKQALQACAIALEKRVGPNGGLDEGTTSRGEAPPKKVRHTLVGLLVHLNCERAGVRGFQQGVDELMVDYLLRVVPEWREDKSHLFGMYASAVALWRALGEPPPVSLTGKWASLRECLDEHLPAMARRLADVRYKPKPEGTYLPAGLVKGEIEASFFVPYYALWRMERSNALMFLPLLFDESGTWLTRKSELPRGVVQRIGTGLALLLEEVQATSDYSEGLIRYHASVGRTEAPRDWGLSAEFVRLLEMPAIRALLQQAGVPERQVYLKMSILRRALHETLDDYGKYYRVFRFTHGLSAGAYLGEEVARYISPRQLTVLDEQIAATCAELCSEQTLHHLAQCILTGRPVTAQEDQEGNSPLGAKMLTELFVRTLAAGDHALREQWTDSSYDRTIAYFNRPTTKANPTTNSGIHDTLFLRLMHVFGRSSSGRFLGLSEEGKGHYPADFTSGLSDREEELRAADLGCGDGKAAKWLIDRGFHVTLIDGSEEMNKRAKETLGGANRDKFEILCRDVREIDHYLTRSSFDLVIANALFVHISPMHAGDLLSKVYNVLKPGGCFFFNVKIRDHTLVSLDGRYFAYYPNSKIPKSMLRNAGFEVDEVALRENNQTCYGIPKPIYWANFYCEKPK